MNIAGLRVRVYFHKKETVVDTYGNHRSVWTEAFFCWASVSQKKDLDENTAAGTTTPENRLSVTVRWSEQTASVTTGEYRMVIAGLLYNIVSIDEQGFRKKSRKFTGVLVER